MDKEEEEFHANMGLVERADNGPVVFFPYGFKFIDFDGKKYMTPMEKHEYEEHMGLIPPNPLCGTLSYPNCSPGSGCGPIAGMCAGKYVGSGYICRCMNSFDTAD